MISNTEVQLHVLETLMNLIENQIAAWQRLAYHAGKDNLPEIEGICLAADVPLRKVVADIRKHIDQITNELPF